MTLTLASGNEVLHGRQLFAVVLRRLRSEREVGDGGADVGQVVEGPAGAVRVAEGVDGARWREDDLDFGVAFLPGLGVAGAGEHLLDLLGGESKRHPAFAQRD